MSDAHILIDANNFYATFEIPTEDPDKFRVDVNERRILVEFQSDPRNLSQMKVAQYPRPVQHEKAIVMFNNGVLDIEIPLRESNANRQDGDGSPPVGGTNPEAGS